MLKILQATPQQYVNQKLQDVKAEFRKGRGTRGQIVSIHWIIEKAREFQKKYLLLLHWLCKRLCVDHNKMWKILKEMRISDNLICLLGSLYADQEATFRTRHGKMDWFKIENVVYQSISSPCLFNLYTEFIMWNVGLKEAQARIKIFGRNINNLKYADDTTLMAES